MRILFINQYFPPDASATAHLLGELVEDLSPGDDVRVVAGRPSYNPEAGATPPAGVHIVRAPSTAFSRSSTAGRALNYLTFTLSAALHACRAPRPDIVVTMTDPPVIGLVGLVAAVRHRRPFVQICQDLFPDIAMAMGRLRAGPAVSAWRLLNRVVRARAAKLIVVGREMGARLEREGVPADKIEFIPGWANPQDVAPAAVRQARDEMGWGDRFVVMHAGNVGLAQNLDVLLDAAESWRREPDVVLVFLGDGAARAGLEAEARRRGLPNVVFLPYRPKPEAQALMAVADVHVISLVPGLGAFAAPSKTYGVMAAGRPFVAAVDEYAEPARVATDYRCGIQVPAGDAAALAGAVSELRDQDTHEMGRLGQAAFRSHYARSVGTAAIGEVLRRVASAA